MKSRKPKNIDPVSQKKAANSWVGKIISDSFQNKLGLVIGIKETDDGFALKALFPGEATYRTVYLDSRPDGNCLTPEMPKARYRPPRQAELDRLQKSEK